MKRFLCSFLILAMLCATLALSACENKDNTSSEAVSSEESVVPPTKTEQLDAAFSRLETYFQSISDTAGIDLGSLSAETGKMEMMFSIDDLSSGGESMLGDSPLKFAMEILSNTEAVRGDAILSAYGDDVKLTVYQKDGKQYLQFPDLYDDTAFTVSADAEDGADESAAAVSFDALVEALSTAFSQTVDLEEALVVSEDGKTFTVSVSKEQTAALLNAAVMFFEENGLKEALAEYVDLDSVAENPLDIVLELKTEENAITYSGKGYRDAEVVSEFSLSASAANGQTAVALEVAVESETLLELSATASDNQVVLNGEMNFGTAMLDLAMTATKASDTEALLSGSVSVTMDMDGMLITIPVSLEGSLVKNGETVSLGTTLSASVGGDLTASISLSYAFTPGTPTVELPFDESSAGVLDPEDLTAKMQEAYPNLMGIAGSGEAYEPFGYANNDFSVFYGSEIEGAAQINLNVTYEKTADSFTFYFEGKEICSVEYEYKNDCYYLYGAQTTTWLGTPEEDGYLESIVYLYYGLFFDIETYDETNAQLRICMPVSYADGSLALQLPDGETLTFAYTENSDGTVTLLGHTLNKVW